jgi:hypothetical protein
VRDHGEAGEERSVLEGLDDETIPIGVLDHGGLRLAWWFIGRRAVAVLAMPAA